MPNIGLYKTLATIFFFSIRASSAAQSAPLPSVISDIVPGLSITVPLRHKSAPESSNKSQEQGKEQQNCPAIKPWCKDSDCMGDEVSLFRCLAPGLLNDCPCCPMPIPFCSAENCKAVAPNSFCSTSLLLNCECYEYEPTEWYVQPDTQSPTTDEQIRALSEAYWAREREKNPAAGMSSAGDTRAEGSGGAGTEAGDEGIIQGRFDSNWGSKSEIEGNIGSMREYEILEFSADCRRVSFF